VINVFICEDQEAQRKSLEKLIKIHISMELLDMSISLSAHDPHELLDYVKTNKIIDGLYFLDIDLKTDMNGIELAAEIRKYDKRGMIAFITAEKDAHKLVFEYYIEAIGYVEKLGTENMRKGIIKCITKAQERLILNEEKRFVFKVGENSLSRPYSEILYFEKSENDKNKVSMVTTTGQFEFFGILKEIANAHKSFHQADRSYVFNMDNVVKFEKKKGQVTLLNGIVCYISSRKKKDFAHLMNMRRSH